MTKIKSILYTLCIEMPMVVVGVSFPPLVYVGACRYYDTEFINGWIVVSVFLGNILGLLAVIGCHDLENKLNKKANKEKSDKDG